MKKITILILLFITGCAWGQMEFVLEGKIDGLKVGDTLSFSKLSLPEYTKTPAFNVVISKNDHFSYRGQHEDMQVYSMEYSPKEGKVKESSKISLSILVNKGKYTLSGNTDFIYYLKISGGDYDDPLFQKMNLLDDSLQMERSRILHKLSDTTNLPENRKTLSEQFNNFYNVNSSHFARLRELKKDYRKNATNSNLVASELVSESVYNPLDAISSQLNNLSDVVKNGRYGKQVTERVALLKALEPGMDAPDFTLENKNGTFTLDSFKGKYLLIYHYGMCPGSMQINSYVGKLHNNHKDKINIIGVTENLDEICKLYDQIDKDFIISGVNMKETLGVMINQPFESFNLKTQKDNLGKKYIFGGLPFFILISPEGKMMNRGFVEVFQTASDLFNPVKETVQ